MKSKFPQAQQFPSQNEALDELSMRPSTADSIAIVLLAVVVIGAAMSQLVDLFAQ